MSLEASDLNDGAILQATRQIGGANDTVKFVITLPSGREFSSEYFQNERKREALHSWLSAVRQQVVFESEEAEAAAKRAYFEKQALEKRDLAMQPGPVVYVPPETSTRPSNGIALPAPSEEDALSHAKRMVASALQAKGLAMAAHTNAAAALGEADKNLKRWTQVLSVLEQPETE